MSHLTQEEAREASIIAALSNPNSEYYKHICRMLTEAMTVHRQAEECGPYVTIPFNVSEDVVAALEHQFHVQIRVRSGFIRSRNTERIAAFLCVLDASLLEYAGGGAASVLIIDGDIVTMAAQGMERRMIERSHAHSRLVSGYYEEDQAIERGLSSKNTQLRINSHILRGELADGFGEHYSATVRPDGPRVDALIVNHFKTPMCLAQFANLLVSRGGVGYGVFPFQVEMLYQDVGDLRCFPGSYCVDREGDTITFIPKDDASMCVSHPYSSLMAIVNTNSIAIGGVEFLCEKYNSVSGVLYYTLKPLVSDIEVNETLRSYYYDTQAAKVSVISYPKATLSSEGVPVGFERGEVRILTSRLDKIIGKMAIHTAELVTPADVMVALVNENNMVVNTLDSAALPERVDAFDLDDVALAVALHINWRRHAAKGTFNVLLKALKLRHSASGASLLKMGFLALSAWWHRPRVGKNPDGEFPVAKIADWCGNDFSVVIDQVDPWIEIVQDKPVDPRIGYRPCPGIPVPQFYSREPIHRSVSKSLPLANFTRKNFPVKSVVLPPVITEEISSAKGSAEFVAVTEVETPRTRVALSDLKQTLKKKMVREQYSLNYDVPPAQVTVTDAGVPDSIPFVAVPGVDPISSIRSDLDSMLGGLPERDVVYTGHQVAEVEESRVTTGNLEINDSKRMYPKSQVIRRPKVDAAVEGRRVASSASLMGALFKRNIGIPNNQGVVNLDLMPAQSVQRVIDTCFKPNWQSIVENHIENGMWESNEPDLEEFLSGLDEKKVGRMLDEFFDEGCVKLDDWMLMAKGKIKPSREEGSESQVDHSQTILFLESLNTNGMYSAMTKRFKLCIDECLEDYVKLNPQWNSQDSEAWYNSREPYRRVCGKTYSYSADTKRFDRSQGHPCLRTETEFYRRLGLSRERFKIWETTHGKKRAMSRAFGIIAYIVLSGISGIWKTLLRNGLIQLTAVIVSADIHRGDLIAFEVKGDDIDLETRRPIKVESAVDKMSLVFNLVSKFNTNNVRYFCKNFRIKIEGRWVEVADPWARLQSLCQPIPIEGHSDASMVERWVSLKDSLRGYDNLLVVDAAAEAAQELYGLKIVPYGIAYALSAVAADKNKFMKFFNPPERIC